MPALARDYQPAVLDPAAMPVRVEQWMAGGKREFRVIGIVWGSPLVRDLLIRFGPDEAYVPVSRVEPAGRNPWGLWTHLWRPHPAGTYRIRLRLADASIRARRLDTGFYVRQVYIERV
jgi:hypothetical protein